VATVSKDIAMISDFTTSCEVSLFPLTLNTNPPVPSVSTFDSFPLDDNSSLAFEEQLSNAQQSRWGLLAMMGPPLDHFSKSPVLDAPMYGDLGPIEESHFFSYFNAT
jgi:hypothetical protein